MGLILRYAEQLKSGRWQYRRRVPKAVAEVITKREYKGKLGDSEREALAAYPRFHAQVEQEIANALRGRLLDRTADRDLLTERQAYDVAQERAATLAPEGTDWQHRDGAAEGIANRYSRDPETQDPIGATAVDRHTINALRTGGGASQAPEWTLEDARKLYLREHVGGEAQEDRRRIAVRLLRVVGLVGEALGGRDPVLIDLTREDARNVRDHMLDRLKTDGTKISPSSVTRDLNNLRAIINFSATEIPLPATFQNPFNKLSVKSIRGQTSERGKRDPLPPAILKAARERIAVSARQPLPLIWRLLAGTGCRLAEITGLRVEDVDVSSDLPHVRIAWHKDRRIKNDSSARSVPLLGDALGAAQEALDAAGDGALLFPSYGGARGPDAASAAIMKHLRKVTKDPKHVVHSLRHNMKDRLRLAEVAQIEQDLILGHALEGVGDRTYGGEAARLKATTRAMVKAFKVDK